MRENVGFLIVASVPIAKSLEVVIGYKETSLGEQYVCWYCKNNNDYFWGRYAKKYEDVIHIMVERIETYYPIKENEENNYTAVVD